MKSATNGASTSIVEVTNISAHGFWLWVDGTEHFLPYADFPWFKNAKVADILHVERHGNDHLHWPALDVDLTLDMIENPRAYPLVYK
jgi:hypothetical protein